MQRGRFQTEQRLIEAVGKLISEEGFHQVGINRIASRAGVNKILIYRYFGGLDGLLEAYFKAHPPVIATAPIDIERLKVAPLDEFFDICCAYIVAEFRLLRQNVQVQELLKADLFRSGHLHNPVADLKEAQFRTLIDTLAEVINTRYGRPFSAIIISAMTLLTLQSQLHKIIFGLDLGTDEGWEQIEIALQHIFRGAYLYTKERLMTEESA